jgi:endogenous inhibitor of DNA gyrase (YacG/DUF329 family)
MPKPAPANTPRPCPVCGQPARPEARPFCSPRCRTIDLGRWFGGAYAIPAAPEDKDDDEAER